MTSSIGSRNALLQTTSLKPVLKINARPSRLSPCISCNAAKKVIHKGFLFDQLLQQPVYVSTEKTLATAGAISAAAYLVPQFANAAQEVALLADVRLSNGKGIRRGFHSLGGASNCPSRLGRTRCIIHNVHSAGRLGQKRIVKRRFRFLKNLILCLCNE